MAEYSFFPSELGGKNSPFVLSTQEWTVFYEYVQIFISSPSSLDELQQQITNKFGPFAGTVWYTFVHMGTFSGDVQACVSYLAKYKNDCQVWRDSNHDNIILLGQSIADYAKVIDQQYRNDINEIIKEARQGKISPETKEKFIQICNSLKAQSESYYAQVQPVISSLHDFYVDLQSSHDTLTNLYNTLEQDFAEYTLVAGMFALGPLAIYLAQYMAQLFQLSDIPPFIDTIQSTLLPIVQKVHGIWDGISGDLGAITDQMEKLTDEDLSPFILRIRLDSALDDWAAVSDEAQQFVESYKKIHGN
ncbi:hypothetical protein [Brevibacillus dissolubilis]|uniref:hypothetical protein n=1 Tax=Brevibacillus dissolubilis TaxID=1844116 RepID=UPI0011164679|nr:hypothetical protein [Brevibacillus dissolubilis]